LAAEPGFPFVVVSCRLVFCRWCGGFLRQPPPTNKNFSRHFNKLPLQSLPDYVIPVRTGTPAWPNGQGRTGGPAATPSSV